MTMRQPTLLVLACVAIGCLSPPGFATENVRQAQAVLRSANEAYADRDYEAFVQQLEKALDLNPASLATRYNLACGYALTGQKRQALDLLGQLVDMRADYGMAADPDLASLRDEPAFRELLTRLERNLKPVSASREVLRVGRLDLIPEGIALDPTTGRLFFGSMRNGEIYVIEGESWSRFAAIKSPAGFSVLGLTVDEPRNTLWSIGSATELAEDFDEQSTITTGLFGFDLDTGRPVREYLADPSIATLNDVTVAANGDIYLSGTELAVITAAEDRIRPLATTPILFGTNGVTVTPDGRTLFTSVYPASVAVIELSSGNARFLSLPDNESLYGVDGLYWHDGDLVAIQQGLRPWRLLRMALDDAQSAVTDIRLIEFANPHFTATTGAIREDEIIYIAQGPPPDPAPVHVPAELVPSLGETIIMAAPLDAASQR